MFARHARGLVHLASLRARSVLPVRLNAIGLDMLDFPYRLDSPKAENVCRYENRESAGHKDCDGR